jgi:hypothetical protein
MHSCLPNFILIRKETPSNQFDQNLKWMGKLKAEMFVGFVPLVYKTLFVSRRY